MCLLVVHGGRGRQRWPGAIGGALARRQRCPVGLRRHILAVRPLGQLQQHRLQEVANLVVLAAPLEKPEMAPELIEGLRDFVEELDRPRIADQTTLAVDLEHLVRVTLATAAASAGHWWTGRAPWAS